MAALYLDEDVATYVAALLQAEGHTVLTTRSQRRVNATDGDQLVHSALNGWILVSHNANDFKLLHDAWHRWATAYQCPLIHSGILIVPQQYWSHERLAHEINAMVASGTDVNNQLYFFDRELQSWQQYVPRS